MDPIYASFKFYDNFISRFSPEGQFFISLLILLLLAGSIIGLLKHGHWIFLILILLFIPGAWPATMHIGEIIWMVLKFLFVRIETNMFWLHKS
ncbi:MAG: hypothetical protein WC227_02840 [Patescibacteria group bacterium]|jgi:hypothetical protein